MNIFHVYILYSYIIKQGAFMEKGFTLAEVLVTLGIIGVVAALTMPALIANYKKTEYSARLKKFNSTMQQAILMYNTDSGEVPGTWGEPENNSEAVEEYWQKHFAPYFQNVVKLEKARNEYTSWRNGFIVYFGDGTKLGLSKGGTIDLKYDVNGDKLPNKYGRDQYIFLLQKGNFSPYNWRGDISNIEPPEGEENYTTDMNDRNNLVRLCKRDTTFCSQLLQLDGWEYKPDYPHRL